MAKLLKLRGGTTSQHNSFTGAAREVTVDTDKETLVVHDGSTAGGHSLMRSDIMQENLDVNGNSIVSSSNGNISITPNGSGKVIIDGLSHPTSDGSNGQFLKTDGGGNLSFATVSQPSNATTSDAGLMSAADKTKLDGIEASSTADQTASEIRTLVESASDSNVFTDADHTKLNGIAASATNVTNTNQLTNGAGFVTSSGVTSVATGSGLTGGTITSTGTLSHSDTSSQGSVNNSGNTFIQDISLDGFGHVTSLGSGTVSGGSLSFSTLTVNGNTTNYILHVQQQSTVASRECISMQHHSIPGSTSDFMSFKQNNGQEVGRIRASGQPFFAGASDYRVKKDVNYNFDATSVIKKLKPVEFKYVDGIGDDEKHIGFIAHELQAQIPEMVFGDKDGMADVKDIVCDADGNQLQSNVTEDEWTEGKADGTYPNDSVWSASKSMMNIQTVNESYLVPLLTKTIIELEARIAALESA